MRLPHLWRRDHAVAWYRKTIVVPEKIGPWAVDGEEISLDFGIDDDCTLFIDGVKVRAFRDLGSAVLTDKARPGEKRDVAFRVINRAGQGGIASVRMRLSRLDGDAYALSNRAGNYLQARAAGMGSLLPGRNAVVKSAEQLIDALSAGSAADARFRMRQAASAAGMLDSVFSRFPLITAGPYLQNLTRSGVTVMWETNVPSTTALEWGPERGVTHTLSSGGLSAMHRVRIEGIAPDRAYRYRVRSGDTRTRFYPFRSAPGPRTPFTFTVAADTHASFASLQERIVEGMAKLAPRFTVFAGDVTNTGSVEEWRSFHLYPARKLMRATATFIAPGNHDHYLSRHDGTIEALERFAEHPGNGYYYAFTQGNSRFIVLDTSLESEPGISPHGAQYRWLENELAGAASTRAAWRFVFLHHPVYSEGWADRYYDGEEALQRHIAPLLERHNVTMAFSRHTHDFEFGQWPQRTGVCYVITGGGGGLLDDTRYRDWPQIQKVSFQYHFCAVSVDEGKVVLRAIDPAGRVMFRHEMRRNAVRR